MYQRPMYKDILKAKRKLSQYLPKTPLYNYPSLTKMLGFETYIKHENHQPTGAFKVRGGINLISSLNDEERERGVITASTGNHGLSIAYAANIFKVKATVVVPREANMDKVEAIRCLGAEVVFHGKDFHEAKIYTEKTAIEKGYRYVHSGNEPLLIAGVGTIGIEILEDLPDVEAIIVPVGGGSGASGIAIAAKTINPLIKIIGVQAENAPSIFLSWKQGKIVETESAETFADGLANRRAFELPLEIIQSLVDDFVLVSEQEMREAILLLLEKTHNLAEGAGAASLAASIKNKNLLRGLRVAIILSGGNITKEMLNKVLNDEQLW